MRNAAISWLAMLGAVVTATSQQSNAPSIPKVASQNIICQAAESQFRKSGQHEVIISLQVNSNGEVRSFKTESPKGLKLEKVRETAEAVKAIRFAPAKSDQPSPAVVRLAIDCQIASENVAHP